MKKFQKINIELSIVTDIEFSYTIVKLVISLQIFIEFLDIQIKINIHEMDDKNAYY